MHSPSSVDHQDSDDVSNQQQHINIINTLIVDDDPKALDLVSELLPIFLPEMNFDIKLAENGRQALEFLNSECFDLLITDYSMPEINGLELIKAINADNSHSQMKILLMTGAEYSTGVSEALSLSHAHMFKPINTEHLTEIISSWFGEKTA